ncbi:rhomboid family intramembrane serine protease [Mycolicibacter kumamotonensis]|jgi:membrane associated rhomboid family serine protease|uniref:Membrane protein n=1 Tax=Mycolicibacter kumamotonensis TaxID=354243 RepID=A0A1B8SCQ9_9MYCO|nr:rhomboid family intramembrane serine protease [Mycolicibacter kumamotonensis]NDJ91533.1 rhomboid family intramembrane serine protease [Mycolicibacter kumamotonensis]OBY30523.1 membrane protein [Mycolicibacter kumamotonensis]ORA77292.1 rhomboid family intramembrane serine protease [Mycolicibacter kumamotonensis]
MTSRTGASPAPRPDDKSGWRTGGATVVGFVALLYLVEAVDQVGGHRLDRNGIRPLESDGLWGVLYAPLLHANWAHLLANTGPALVLGFLVTLAGQSRFLLATAIVWLVGGLGTWLIGNVGSACGPTDHIGASGLIFGWLAFLVVFGWFTRSIWQILVGLVVLVLYGGILWGAVPVLNVCGGVSWQGHLCGALAGVLAAYLLSGPERKARARRRAVAA